MEPVLEILTCKYCMKMFKSTPIILNCCSETICDDHISEFRSINSKGIFTCMLCNNSNDQVSFPTNKIAERFINLNLQKLEFGDNYNRPKNNCKKLENLIRKYEEVNKDPVNYIFEHVSHIKFQIDVKREELKEKIDKISNDLIKRVESFESDCYKNLKSKIMKKKINGFNKELEDIKAKLAKWNNELKEMIINEKGWEIIRSKSIIQCNQLENLIENFKRELVLNKELKYDKSVDILSNLDNDLSINDRWPIFITADFIILNSKNLNRSFSQKIKCLYEEKGEWGVDKIISMKDLLDCENGLYDCEKNEINFEIRFIIEEVVENKIRLQINNFSTWFRELDSIDSSKYTFGDFEWFIEAPITKCLEDDEYYLGFYLFCQSLDNKNNPIKVSANLRLLHLSNDNLLNFEYKFQDIFETSFEKTDNTGYGFSKFFKIKKILDEDNGYYNAKMDSITLEATFNYSECLN